MITAFYNGVSGMRAYQEKINTVGHNISNVNASGYKALRSSFTDLLYTQMNTKVEGENLVGHGVKQQATDLMLNVSSVENTMYPLDFAITGDGFFAVRETDGETINYTRAGNFYISVTEDGNYLVTSDGAHVLDREGEVIMLPNKRVGGEYNEEGELEGGEETIIPDTDGLLDRIGLYIFRNAYGLESQNGLRFKATTNSGEAEAMEQEAARGIMLQGYLEFSGVDLGNEMVHMIEAQRAFQMNVRVVQTADEMESQVNNLR